ncbi:MAG: GGDEF domain-containing protein [Deltaproteobacteria bacterium]|nr:GGDEF domain-containing protein [Deltaproteobacteria bacterium]
MSNGEKEEKTRVIDLKEIEAKSNPRSRHPYFVCVSGKLAGKQFKREQNEMLIGRSDEADIQIEDEGVSRKHAKIAKLADGQIRIIDLGSTNGTFFNGTRISEHVLKDGDKIQIGSTTILKFSIQDDLDEQYQKQQYDSATRDHLTKLFNRKFFAERYIEEFSYALRHSKVYSLAILDIDHFKKVNDTYGHQAGDYVLRQLADVVSQLIRNEDILARYGGEEFVLLLRDTDEEKAFVVAMRIRRAIEKHEFKFQDKIIPITVSIGIATLINGNFKTPEEMFRAADEYLYKAKNNGRNRVESIINA